MNLKNIELPSNRKFGFFFTLIFIIFGSYFLRKGLINISIIFYALAALTLIITLIKADLLLPFNKLWMRLGLIMGKIISPIVLAIIFLFVFTLIGSLMRLFGRDELRIKPKKRETYWKERNDNNNSSDPFKYQF